MILPRRLYMYYVFFPESVTAIYDGAFLIWAYIFVLLDISVCIPESTMEIVRRGRRRGFWVWRGLEKPRKAGVALRYQGDITSCCIADVDVCLISHQWTARLHMDVIVQHGTMPPNVPASSGTSWCCAPLLNINSLLLSPHFTMLPCLPGPWFLFLHFVMLASLLDPWILTVPCTSDNTKWCWPPSSEPRFLIVPFIYDHT